MRLVSATITNFRKITGPLTVAFEAGLNLLHGQNEIGKSTLVEAVWAALTMSAKGNTERHRQIQPYSGATPQVQVTFVDGGDTWTVDKTFGSTGRCHLRRDRPGSASETLSDHDAEQLLRTQLRVGKPTRGELRPEHSGRWRVLWVRQGESGADPQTFVVAEAGQELNRSLAAETDEVIAGDEAMTLFREVAAQLDRYFTAQGKERTGTEAPLARARAAVDEAGVELAGLQQRRRALESDLGTLSQVELSLARHASMQPGIELELAAAQAAATAVTEAERRVETTSQALAASASRRDLWEERAKERATLNEALAQRAERLGKTREWLEVLQRQCNGSKDPSDALVEAMETAVAEERRLGASAAAAGARHDAAQAARERHEARIALDAIQTRSERIATLQGKLKVEPCDDQALARIRNFDRACQGATAALQAAGVKVHVQAHSDQQLQVQDQAIHLTAGQELEHDLLERTTFTMEAATIQVIPGGAGIAEARHAFDTTQRELRQALQDLGAGTISEVEERAAARRLLAVQLQALQHEQDVMTTGQPALQEREQQALQELARARALLPDQEVKVLETTPLDPLAITRLREEARALGAAHESQRLVVQKVKGELEEIQAAERHHEEKIRAAQTSFNHAHEEWQKQENAVANHVELHGDDTVLAAELRQARQQLEAATSQQGEAKAALAALDPDEVTRRLRAAQRRLANAETSQREDRDRRLELRSRIEAYTGGGGSELDEKLEVASAKKARADRELERALLDAKAWRLLHDTMRAHKESAERRLRAPLLRQVNRLLQILLPDAELVFADESFQNIQLKRQGTLDPTFAELSAGAREQIGIILRLAMAMVMRGEEELPVVLDDALVTSDDCRLRGMVHVLDRAARELQILLVTCQAERLLAAGLAPHRIVDLDRLM